MKAVRAACRSGCNASRQRAHLFAFAAVILSPCPRDGLSLLIRMHAKPGWPRCSVNTEAVH